MLPVPQRKGGTLIHIKELHMHRYLAIPPTFLFALAAHAAGPTASNLVNINPFVTVNGNELATSTANAVSKASTSGSTKSSSTSTSSSTSKSSSTSTSSSTSRSSITCV